MPKMSDYCKAIYAEQLRQFPKWSESAPPLMVNDTPYFYVHSDLVVTAGIFRDEKIVFDKVTDEWKEFCANVVKIRTAPAI
jgi:hypothetical protein